MAKFVVWITETVSYPSYEIEADDEESAEEEALKRFLDEAPPAQDVLARDSVVEAKEF